MVHDVRTAIQSITCGCVPMVVTKLLHLYLSFTHYSRSRVQLKKKGGISPQMTRPNQWRRPILQTSAYKAVDSDFIGLTAASLKSVDTIGCCEVLRGEISHFSLVVTGYRLNQANHLAYFMIRQTRLGDLKTSRNQRHNTVRSWLEQNIVQLFLPFLSLREAIFPASRSWKYRTETCVYAFRIVFSVLLACFKDSAFGLLHFLIVMHHSFVHGILAYY